MAGRPPSLEPESQFPDQAIQQSVVVPPPPEQMGAVQGFGNLTFTWNIASVADSVAPWGINVKMRDKQLRDFISSESFIGGAMANIAARNSGFEWEVRGPSEKVITALTDVLNSALAGTAFGWSSFISKFTQDLHGQDNGAVLELIRDPGLDANSKFKGPAAPVIGIGHLDSGQCIRTGNMETPVVYVDRTSIRHKMYWYQVIPFSEFPSSIERMYGVGVCSVSRALRLAQIMRSISIYKDERISGRHYKQLHLVGGVSRTDIDTAKQRGREDADNAGQLRFIEPAILASLDPEKPVSVATIDLAGFPDGFNFDQEMQWYVSGLALAFNTDYQEFAPLPGGQMGGGAQSPMLARRSSGKGPAVFMRILPEALSNYGFFPKGYSLVFKAKDLQDETDKQTIRKMALEEAALAMRNGILTPDAMRQDLVRRAIYDKLTIEGIDKNFGLELAMTTVRETITDPGATQTGEGVQVPKVMNSAQTSAGSKKVGQVGGNTMAEDAARTPVGGQRPSQSGRLQK